LLGGRCSYSFGFELRRDDALITLFPKDYLRSQSPLHHRRDRPKQVT
jgi:hypothetical protein